MENPPGPAHGRPAGLYIEHLVGVGAGGPYSTELSAKVHVGFRIRGGEVIGRVSECFVSVDVMRAFGDELAALGSEAHVTPSMYVMQRRVPG